MRQLIEPSVNKIRRQWCLGRSTAFAFIPFKLIKSAALQLKAHIQEEAVDFINYVERNHIGSFRTESLPGSVFGMRLVWKSRPSNE